MSNSVNLEPHVLRVVTQIAVFIEGLLCVKHQVYVFSLY